MLTLHQDNFREVIEAQGIKSPAYYSAFAHMRKQCRENGIDAALHPTVNGKRISLDALLFCDVRGAGQQIAAQACAFLPSHNSQSLISVLTSYQSIPRNDHPHRSRS